MILAVDIGNSFVKWKLRDKQGGVLDYQSVALAQLPQALEALAGAYAIEHVYYANVSHHMAIEQIKAVLLRSQFHPLVSTSCWGKVVNAYEQPSQLGVDRWLGVIEAFYAMGESACCVVDAGTAITLDVVDAQGMHQGGFIVPGLTMMQQSLQQQTFAIALTQLQAEKGYGKNTTHAVKNGVRRMLVTWLERELQCFRQRYPQGKVVFTGGDAAWLLSMISDENITLCKDLVLDALWRISKA